MNLALKVTIIRFAAAPLFLFSLLFLPAHIGPYVAIFLGVLAIITDVYDGYLARSRDQVTTTGKLLDPIADVAFFVTAYACFYYHGWLPLMVLMIICIRELTINIFARPYLILHNINPQARIYGKIKTAMQSVFLFFVLLAMLFEREISLNVRLLSWILAYLLAVFSVLSGMSYILAIIKKKRSNP